MIYVVELDVWKGICAPLGLVVDSLLPECCRIFLQLANCSWMSFDLKNCLCTFKHGENSLPRRISSTGSKQAT